MMVLKAVAAVGMSVLLAQAAMAQSGRENPPLKHAVSPDFRSSEIHARDDGGAGFQHHRQCDRPGRRRQLIGPRSNE